MRAFRLALVIAGAFAAGSASVALTSAQPDRAADTAAIRAHIESIFAAFIDKDRPKLEATHGREWRGFLGRSRSVIRGIDGYMAAAVGSGPMAPKGQGMVGYRMHDFDVVFYGDTAVASFVADVDYKQADRAWTTKLSLLDVYVKENGAWNQMASNTSLHPDYQDELMSAHTPLTGPQKQAVLEAREAVWRAWHAGDVTRLTALLPPELVTLGPGAGAWATRDEVIAGARSFAAGGGKLIRLAFPRTEFQRYGNTVLIYTSYEREIESSRGRRTEKGLATEIFVRRGNEWLNTGWQMAPEPADGGTR